MGLRSVLHARACFPVEYCAYRVTVSGDLRVNSDFLYRGRPYTDFSETRVTVESTMSYNVIQHNHSRDRGRHVNHGNLEVRREERAVENV